MVVDDASEDATEAVARDAGEHVVYHRLSERSGVAHARNVGVGLSTGAWVSFLDDDDVWAPHKLAAQLAAAAQRGARWAYAGGVVLDELLTVIDVQLAPRADALLSRLLVDSVLPGGCSNVLAERSLLIEVGGFDEELSIIEDWDLYIRLAAAAPAAVVDEALVGYVEHAGSWSVRHRDREPDELAHLQRKHEALFQMHDVNFERTIERWRLLRAHSSGRRLEAVAGFVLAAARRPSRRALRDVAFALRGPCRIHERRRRRAEDRPERVPNWLTV